MRIALAISRNHGWVWQIELGQVLEQCPGLLQVERVETLGEPAIDRGEKIVSVCRRLP